MARSSLETLVSMIDATATASDLEQLREEAHSEMEKIFYRHEGLASDKWHHYLAIYDRYLSRYRGTPARLLEIGVQNGGSLEIWRRYLGVEARLQGLDIDPRCALLPVDAEITIGDQGDPQVLGELAAGDKPLDIVIDDGGHRWADQIQSFTMLFPHLASDGVYICEDIHTSYVDLFGDRAAGDLTFVEYVKRLIDGLHVQYRTEACDVSSDLASTIRGIHVHDSIVVIEKGSPLVSRRVITGQTRLVTGL